MHSCNIMSCLGVGIVGYLIPVCALAFVGSSMVRLLSWLFFISSEAYNSLEGVRPQWVLYFNHPLRRGLTTWVTRLTAVAGTSLTGPNSRN